MGRTEFPTLQSR